MFLDILSTVGTTLAGTGTEADASQGRVMTLMTGLCVTVAGVGVMKKGAMKYHEGERLTSQDLGNMAVGASLIAGGGALAVYMTGKTMGATTGVPALSIVGDVLSELCNPVGPAPVMLTYLYYKLRRHGHQ